MTSRRMFSAALLALGAAMASPPAMAEGFWDDLGNAYKRAVRGFADAGCRYLQLDEVFIAMLCDPKYRDQMTKRGDDPEKLGPLYAKLINAAMSDIPADTPCTRRRATEPPRRRPRRARPRAGPRARGAACSPARA